MDSHDRFPALLVICGTLLFLGIMGMGMYSALLRHSCNLHGFHAQYDSAHINQICGK